MIYKETSHSGIIHPSIINQHFELWSKFHKSNCLHFLYKEFSSMKISLLYDFQIKNILKDSIDFFATFTKVLFMMNEIIVSDLLSKEILSIK